MTLGSQMFAMVLLALLLALVFGVVLSSQSARATSYDTEEERFLQLINEYRQSNGLGPLVLSDTLADAAEHHSEDMGEHDFFAHDTVASSYYPAGSEPWDRMEAEGYDFNTYKGENLAAGYATAEEAMRAWQASSAHNAAMLDGHYKVIGIARVNVPGSSAGWYWTTDFGGFVDPSAHGAGQAPGQGPRADDQTDDQRQERRPVAAPRLEPPETVAPKARDLGGIENGDMQRRTVWDQRARDGANLLFGGHARLGGYNNGNDELRQRIRVKPDGKLSYRVRIATEEKLHPFDGMLVRLVDARGEQLAVLRNHTDAEAGRWQTKRADLSRFAGRTVYLSFHARTDRVLPTTFYVDTVRQTNDARP